MLHVFFRAGHWRTFYYMSEMSTGFLRATSFTVVQPRIYVIKSKVSSSVSLLVPFSSQGMGSMISTAQYCLCLPVSAVLIPHTKWGCLNFFGLLWVTYNLWDCCESQWMSLLFHSSFKNQIIFTFCFLRQSHVALSLLCSLHSWCSCLCHQMLELKPPYLAFLGFFF